MKNEYYIKKLWFTGPGIEDSPVEFINGLNIIHGANDTGKSWILDSFDFMCGLDHEKFVIDKSTGCDTVHLEVETGHGTVTMTRQLESTKIDVESTDPRIDPHQYTAGKSKYWINSVWMKILGIDDNVKVIMNENAKRQSLTLRSFLNLLCVSLENMNRRQSIFYTSGGPFSKTAMKSTLLYFLNEEEFEEYKEVTGKKQKNAEKKIRALVKNENLEYLSELKLAVKKEALSPEQVKERILEFLAVRSLTKKGESPILCLVGPPGTGKTSIARSVARALDKKYVRICLGGVRDEAEIRGHRKTYVGAMPGRLVNGLRSAGVKNPLMLLDEIDKVSSDYKGDTSSALLEVLDSEQNHKFRDHYVELPIDLSEVLFIATANSMQGIPRPLLDRMELIEVTSYTENEKLHIAREHLLAKQTERNGLKEDQFKVSDGALAKIISGYTREAGVRGLERRIGEIARKAAREIYEGKSSTVDVTVRNLEKYLGKEKYSQDMRGETDEVGIVRGLAWTSVGGDTLEIEVNVMPGKGEFQLTGQLGDVMKESAQTGISYIRSVGGQYDIPAEFFQKNDIHIHIPEGAVPKDGPSAGITMATAMLSAITGTPVRADVAMTGEITLRGRVLPIGGLKEKLLAAKNAGVRTVCVPKKNEKDVEEISGEIKKGLEIVYVETMEQVLRVAFCEKKE